MKIYGGRDYYDCALSLGVDPNVTLVRDRKPNRVSLKEAGFSLLPEHKLALGVRRPHARRVQSSAVEWNLRNVAVAFCTKVYRGAVLTTPDASFEPKYFWSAPRITAFNQQEKKVFIGVCSDWRRKALSLEEYMEPENVPASVREYMIANRLAIMLQLEPRDHLREPDLRTNTTGLKQLGFAKALDPYTAFQELSMWIGGVLGGVSPEVVKITDDIVLAEGHGFDRNFSFRGPRIR